MARRKERRADRPHKLLEERIDHLEFLKSFNHEILQIIRRHMGQGEALESCLQEVVEFIQRKLGLYLVAILMEEKESGDLVLRAAAGRMGNLEALKEFRIRKGQGLAGATYAGGKTIVCPDTSQDERFVAGPARDTVAEICLPIRAADRIVGVLSLQDDRTGRFRKDLTETLEELALNLGMMIENHQLYTRVRQHSLELEEQIEEKTRELLQSERRFRALVENIQDPLLIVDPQGQIRWANGVAAAFFGPEWEAPDRRAFPRFVKKGSLHKVFRMLQDLRKGGIVRDLQLEMVTASGGEKLVEITATPLPGGEGGESFEILLRDITERTVAERLRKKYLKTVEEEVTRRTQAMRDIQRASILALAALAESIDEFTYGHLERMREYSRVIADELRHHPKYQGLVDEEYVEMLYDVSPLHDVGKVGIRDHILQKQGKLTKEEFEKMKEHTEIGANALRMAGKLVNRQAIFAMAEMIARFHHQRWDGSGYPAVKIGDEIRPLRGEEIPLCARIVSLADVYDALTSRRPYKEPYPHEVAREMIVKDSGKHFDPDCVQAFLNRQADFIEIKKKWADTQGPETGSQATPAFRFSMRDEFMKGKLWAALELNGEEVQDKTPAPGERTPEG